MTAAICWHLSAAMTARLTTRTRTTRSACTAMVRHIDANAHAHRNPQFISFVFGPAFLSGARPSDVHISSCCRKQEVSQMWELAWICDPGMHI